MERLLFAVLCLLVLLLVLRKRQSSRPAGSSVNSPAISAAEADPTSTGRYRVQKMLAGQTAKKGGASEKSDDPPTGGEDDQLPDPFDPKAPTKN